MPYLTPAELEESTSALELAQVASPRESRPASASTMRAVIAGGTPAEPDLVAAQSALARILAMIDNATEIVDSKLRLAYTLPLVPTPPLVREIMVRLVRYFLHDERAPREIADRYKEAIQWLGDIATGDMDLGIPGSELGGGDSPQVCAGAPIYTLEGTVGYARWP